MCDVCYAHVDVSYVIPGSKKRKMIVFFTSNAVSKLHAHNTLKHMYTRRTAQDVTDEDDADDDDVDSEEMDSDEVRTYTLCVMHGMECMSCSSCTHVILHVSCCCDVMYS